MLSIMCAITIASIAESIAMIKLLPHQIAACGQIHRGSILNGSVGSGKSITALAYFYTKVCGGYFPTKEGEDYKAMTNPRDLYIITTAKKRDSHEWEKELAHFCLSPKNISPDGVNVIIDSWNNIKKYTKVVGAMFIFDEQRVVGYGAWTKSFLDISRKNEWILLTATPGDTWSDYMPVFIANGYFKNKTDFVRNHVVYSPFTNFPQIDKYVNQGKLIKYRNEVLVNMDYDKGTQRHKIACKVGYSKELYQRIWKDRWNFYDDEPIEETGKLGYLLRRVTNSDPDRVLKLVEILEKNPKTIIFYNFNYELDILRDVCERMCIPHTEWNGEKHEDILDGDNWAYLVQYTAGAEGWNCITTDTIIFYSQSYSYKTTEQAMGRIDRMNTPFKDLYYYILKSNSPIDLAIARALANKRNFNEGRFLRQN